MNDRFDVDGFLASLSPEFDDPGDCPWGTANTPPGEPIIPQSPTRKVGDTVFVSVPGPVPVIRAKRSDKVVNTDG